MPKDEQDLLLNPDPASPAGRAGSVPLAARMRPKILDEFIGQKHILGPGSLLRRAIQADQLSSLIFYGPPGTGKTTLARIIANTTKAHFIALNAVLAGVKDIREAIEEAQRVKRERLRRSILFVDEVHRFNKSQQDALLPHVENGLLVLIGATTENPYFEVNKALVSRSRIFQLKPLEESDIADAIQRAISEPLRGYGDRKIEIDADALEHLVRTASGDARSALNALELAIETTTPDSEGIIRVNLSVAEESIQKRAVLYDKDGDAHYDTISAFIKSVRGSDPDAALYWMAKMIYAGEDPRFIFRRMIILASEDVGLADPQALGVVMSAAQAFDYVGMPEGAFHLSQACLYLSTAPKSNSTMAFFDAKSMVEKEIQDEVPNPLKDGNRDAKGFGHGKGYMYPHAYRDHWVSQQYLPKALQGKILYEPSEQGYEAQIRSQVLQNREAQVLQSLSSQNGEASAELNPWLERANNPNVSVILQVRERMMEILGPKPGEVALDLNADTGLVTFSLCRKVENGTVFAHFKSPARAEAVEAWVKHQNLKVSLKISVGGNFSLFTDNQVPIHLIAGLDLPWKDFQIACQQISFPYRAIHASRLPGSFTNLMEQLDREFLSVDLFNQVQNLAREWDLNPKEQILEDSDAEYVRETHSFRYSRRYTRQQVQEWLTPSSSEKGISLRLSGPVPWILSKLTKSDASHFSQWILEFLPMREWTLSQSYLFRYLVS